jgi:uncharacterized protein
VASGDEPYDYYGTARSASAHWENRVTRGSLHSLMTFDALGAAPLLGATPVLVVHGRIDAHCSPELAAEMHAQVPGQGDPLDRRRPAHRHLRCQAVAEAVAATVDLLRRHL